MFSKEEAETILIALSVADHESQISPVIAQKIVKRLEMYYPGITKDKVIEFSGEKKEDGREDSGITEKLAPFPGFE